jgi:nucleoside-diphosphate-sugar epimerase
MHVVVTGANGFIGKHLTQALLQGQLPGAPAITRLSVLDLALDPIRDDPRIQRFVGSYSDATVLGQCLKVPADLVFHLAAVPSGLCERNPELGMEVNVQGMIRLLDALRAQPTPCKLVFASSIAVYGKPQTTLLTDLTPPAPTLSYGAYKVVGEVLLNDYIRRGWLTGCSLRLPGIVTRPPEPNGAVSIFFSDVIRELSAGRPVRCPVSPAARSWLMSVGCCVRNLLHAATHEFGERRTFMLPAQWVGLQELVDAIGRQVGDADIGRLVDWQPDPWVEFNFGSYPPLELPLASAEGFRPDDSLERLVADSLV